LRALEQNKQKSIDLQQPKAGLNICQQKSQRLLFALTLGGEQWTLAIIKHRAAIHVSDMTALQRGSTNKCLSHVSSRVHVTYLHIVSYDLLNSVVIDDLNW